VAERTGVEPVHQP